MQGLSGFASNFVYGLRKSGLCGLNRKNELFDRKSAESGSDEEKRSK